MNRSVLAVIFPLISAGVLRGQDLFAQDVPSYLRSTQSNQALGGLASNFNDLTSTHKNLTTQNLTPVNCPSGQTLTGAVFANGYTYGGSCTAVPSTVASSTFTAPVAFQSSATFNGGVFGPINASTSGLITANFSSTSNLGVCVATVTLAVSAGCRAVDLILSGQIDNGSSGVAGALGIEEDGVLFDNQTATAGVLTFTGSANFPLQVYYPKACPSSGSHSYCVTISGQGGSTTTLVCSSASNATCRFTAREFR